MCRAVPQVPDLVSSRKTHKGVVNMWPAELWGSQICFWGLILPCAQPLPTEEFTALCSAWAGACWGAKALCKNNWEISVIFQAKAQSGVSEMWSYQTVLHQLQRGWEHLPAPCQGWAGPCWYQSQCPAHGNSLNPCNSIISTSPIWSHSAN